jgi:hypothetical protein
VLVLGGSIQSHTVKGWNGRWYVKCDNRIRQ